MNKKEEKRVVPIKNYIMLGVICIVTILLVIYVNAWIKTYKENAYSTSPLNGMINEVNINELNEPFMEISEVILYVGYTDDQKLFNEEKKLLKVIQKNTLSPYVMYLNVSNENDYIKILQKKFGDEDNIVKNAPLFIYIKEGKTKKIINVSKENDLIRKFENLIETYDVGDEN